jgi:hypothetical protein
MAHDHDHADGHGHDEGHPPARERDDQHERAREHVHAHEHEHTHESDHAHVSAHEHGPSRDHETPLEPVGPGALLFLDAPSGLAGDMIVASLVDLGVPRAVVERAIGLVGMTGYGLTFGRKQSSGISATTFSVDVHGSQPHRTYAQIRALLGRSALEEGTKDRALKTFARLAAAEARVHGIAVEDVHFHEVGAVDAIADVVGSAAALDYLGARVFVSPLPMGRGFVKAAHGVLPLPAPAAVACLEGLVTYDAGIDVELVTPTGAAIVGAHAQGSHRWPTMIPVRVGWGAGSRELPDRPNVLRAVLGIPHEDSSSSDEGATHAVIEANVDDMTGELTAHWIETAFENGALDAWATPMTMKKGRPALTLSALATSERAPAVAEAMLRETTSLGVRIRQVARLERPKTVVSVETPFGAIPIKVSEGPFGPPQAKPEFDVCAAAARAHDVPVREVLRVAMACWASRDRG